MIEHMFRQGQIQLFVKGGSKLVDDQGGQSQSTLI